MDYSQLSDFEINKRVAQLHGGFALTLAVHDEPPSGKAFNPGRFDPCNSPADAWPIIVENSISLYAVGEDYRRGKWGAEGPKAGAPYHFDNNPLRAAMIVFLMMREKPNA